ncbi:MAG: hypothetical protein IJA61_04135 [Clostridia bacterium]|nr:hypothetical protein [Clostridia bacterium]
MSKDVVAQAVIRTAMLKARNDFKAEGIEEPSEKDLIRRANEIIKEANVRRAEKKAQSETEQVAPESAENVADNKDSAFGYEEFDDVQAP